MIAFPIDNEIKRAAKDHYEFQVLNNSITKGKRNAYGAAGEIVFQRYFDKIYGAEFSNDWRYDVILQDKRTVDVKTEITDFIPDGRKWNCSIPATSKSEPMHFFFCLIDKKATRCILLGSISYNRWKFIRQLKAKGTKEGKFKYLEDTYIIDIKDLKWL